MKTLEKILDFTRNSGSSKSRKTSNTRADRERVSYHPNDEEEDDLLQVKH